MAWLQLFFIGHFVVTVGALLIALIQLLLAIGADVLRIPLFKRTFGLWLLYTISALLIGGGLFAKWLYPTSPRPCQRPHTYRAAQDTLDTLSSDILKIKVLHPSLGEQYDAYESAMSAMYMARTAISDACVTLAATPAQDWIYRSKNFEETFVQLQEGRSLCEESAVEIEQATQRLSWTIAEIKEDATAALEGLDDTGKLGQVGKVPLDQESLENSIATCTSAERTIDLLVQGRGQCLREEADDMLVHWRLVQEQPGHELKAAIESARVRWRCAP